MFKRTITAVIGLIVYFLILFAGEIPFNCAVVVVIALMLYEAYKSLKCHKSLWIMGFLSAAEIVFCAVVENDFQAAVFLIIAVYMAVSVFLHGKIHFKDVYAHGFITLFISIFMASVIALRTQFGIYAVLIIFICAWTTDTGAYFAGRFFGKHKLMPKVSPKKTVEGAIGGVIVCMLCCALYLFILNRIEHAGIIGMDHYAQFIVLGGIASMISQMGDLAASAIKRDCGVKDFGNILPGHGGILDRFDSVVFIAPFIYYLMKLLTTI